MGGEWPPLGHALRAVARAGFLLPPFRVTGLSEKQHHRFTNHHDPRSCRTAERLFVVDQVSGWVRRVIRRNTSQGSRSFFVLMKHDVN